MFHFILSFWGIHHLLLSPGEPLNSIVSNACSCLEGFRGKWKDPKISPSKLNSLLSFAFPLNNFLDPCMHCLIASCEETYNFNNGCCASGIHIPRISRMHIHILHGWPYNDSGCALFIIDVNIGPTASFHKTEITLVQNSSKIPIYSKST